MKGKTLFYKGSEFIRTVTMIGDVEKITWFQVLPEAHGLETEIYNSDFANELELVYEENCTAEFTPQLFFI